MNYWQKQHLKVKTLAAIHLIINGKQIEEIVEQIVEHEFQ